MWWRTTGSASTTWWPTTTSTTRWVRGRRLWLPIGLRWIVGQGSAASTIETSNYRRLIPDPNRRPPAPQINGEGNNDGSNDNFSWNCGAEGDTGANEGVVALRFRQMRNFMLVLMASQGVPMMVMGE